MTRLTAITILNLSDGRTAPRCGDATMPKTLVQMRGVKVAREVIARAVRWTERDLRRGVIDERVYAERMAAIEAERRACGLA